MRAQGGLGAKCWQRRAISENAQTLGKALPRKLEAPPPSGRRLLQEGKKDLEPRRTHVHAQKKALAQASPLPRPQLRSPSSWRPANSIGCSTVPATGVRSLCNRGSARTPGASASPGAVAPATSSPRPAPLPWVPRRVGWRRPCSWPPRPPSRVSQRGSKAGRCAPARTTFACTRSGGVASGKRIIYHKNKAENEQLDWGRWRIQPIPAHLIKHDWQKGAYTICADSDKLGRDLCIRGDSKMNKDTRMTSVNLAIPGCTASHVQLEGRRVCGRPCASAVP